MPSQVVQMCMIPKVKMLKSSPRSYSHFTPCFINTEIRLLMPPGECFSACSYFSICYIEFHRRPSVRDD